MAHIEARNPKATVYVGELDPKVTEEILWELMIQCGPVVRVHSPKDKLTREHLGYSFVEFKTEEDADYSIRIMNLIKLYGRPIRVNKASREKRAIDVGANLFVGNLAPEVDEKMLHETFSTFGVLIYTPRIMRDPETGESKGFGFISYSNFESADTAINSMNGQHYSNRVISVSYAYKKDSKTERHGSMAERLLASKNPEAKAEVKKRMGAPAQKFGWMNGSQKPQQQRGPDTQRSAVSHLPPPQQPQQPQQQRMGYQQNPQQQRYQQPMQPPPPQQHMGYQQNPHQQMFMQPRQQMYMQPPPPQHMHQMNQQQMRRNF